MYLSIDDYTLAISRTNLDQILQQASDASGLTTEQVRINAENTAIAEVRAYLNPLYQIDAELGKDSSVPISITGRLPLVVSHIIHIALYNLHFTVNPRDIPELREKAYKNCKEALAAARDEKLDYGLTLKPQDQIPGAQRIALYSGGKFMSKPFEDAILLNPEQFPP